MINNLMEIKQHVKNEIKKANELANNAKRSGKNAESIAWHHTMEAHMGVLDKLENLK